MACSRASSTEISRPRLRKLSSSASFDRKETSQTVLSPCLVSYSSFQPLSLASILKPAAAWSFGFLRIAASFVGTYPSLPEATPQEKNSKNKNLVQPPSPRPPPKHQKKQPRSLRPLPSSLASPGSTPTATPSRPTAARPSEPPTAPTGGTARTNRAKVTRLLRAGIGGSTPSALPPTGPATWSPGTGPRSWRWPR